MLVGNCEGYKIIKRAQRRLADRAALPDLLQQRGFVEFGRIADHGLIQERLADFELELHRAAVDPLQIGAVHHAQTLLLHDDGRAPFDCENALSSGE